MGAGSSVDIHFNPSTEVVTKLRTSMVGELLFPGKAYFFEDEFIYRYRVFGEGHTS